MSGIGHKVNSYYVIENVDQRLEDLKLHSDVEEIQVQDQGKGDTIADAENYEKVGVFVVKTMLSKTEKSLES